MASEGLLGTDELKQQSLVQHEVLITFATTGKTPQDVKQAHMTGQFAAVGLTEAAAQFQEQHTSLLQDNLQAGCCQALKV